MENNIMHDVWPFQIQCYAFWSYECTCNFSKHHEWHIKEFLNNFMIIYIHDILIFSKNLKEHEQHVCFVYNKLWEKMLSVKLKKSCLFHQSKVRFLSYIIFDNGLSMVSKKIQIFIFSLWHQINFLGICKFLSKITQRLLHLQHNSRKQGQYSIGMKNLWKFSNCWRVLSP
jgi:hypothetical protein